MRAGICRIHPEENVFFTEYLYQEGLKSGMYGIHYPCYR